MELRHIANGKINIVATKDNIELLKVFAKVHDYHGAKLLWFTWPDGFDYSNRDSIKNAICWTRSTEDGSYYVIQE